MFYTWAGAKPTGAKTGVSEWAGARPFVYHVSRSFLRHSAEASKLHMRQASFYYTGGGEYSPLHLAVQPTFVASYYVTDDQDVRFVIGSLVTDDQGVRFIIAELVTDEQEVRFQIGEFVTDDQEVRFVLANLAADDQGVRFLLGNFAADDQGVRFQIGKFVTDDQETRYVIGAFVTDDQETRYLIGGLVQDDQGLRFDIGAFVTDDQGVRFAIAGSASAEQGLRFVLANFLSDEQETRFIIPEFAADDQELRFILANFVSDDQELQYILSNFYRRSCPVYFYIEGTGVVVYEPAEGYILDDSYVAARTKVGRFLEVRYGVEPWPTTPVVAASIVQYTIAASGVGGLPAPPDDPDYFLPGSGWYLLGMSVDPGAYKIHDQLCDDFGHVAGQYSVRQWSSAAQVYRALVTPTDDCLTQALALGEGFWCLMPSAAFDARGTPPTGEKAVALTVGWNLVATPYDIRMDNVLVEYASARQPLNYSADKVQGIWYASTTGTGAYTTINVASFPPGTALRGWGYWVKALVDCDLIFREGLT